MREEADTDADADADGLLVLETRVCRLEGSTKGRGVEIESQFKTTPVE